MSESVPRGCWCGVATARTVGVFVTPHGSFTLVACVGCGVQTLWPQPSDEQLSAAYATDYYGATRRKFIWPISSAIGIFQWQRARLAAKWLGSKSGGRILDIGCGNGGFLMRMQAMGFAVEGTEWTQPSAARVPASSGIQVHVGDLLTLDLPRQSFDLITLWHVFEHLRNPTPTLERIRELLKPGGTLIMSLPNVESWQARIFGTNWFHHDPPRHLFAFGHASLSRLLQLGGFEEREFHCFSIEQNPYGFIQSALNACGLPRDRAYSKLKGLGTVTTGTRIVDLSLVALLAVPAIAFSVLESACRRGATMSVVAKRTE